MRVFGRSETYSLWKADSQRKRERHELNRSQVGQLRGGRKLEHDPETREATSLTFEE